MAMVTVIVIVMVRVMDVLGGQGLLLHVELVPPSPGRSC